jgi:hypothetical protein
MLPMPFVAPHSEFVSEKCECLRRNRASSVRIAKPAACYSATNPTYFTLFAADPASLKKCRQQLPELPLIC